MKAASSIQCTLLFVLFIYVESIVARINKRQIIYGKNDSDNNRIAASDCLTPEQQPGTCVRFTECPALVQSVGRSRIHRYICGFIGDEPKVCCPMPSPAFTAPTSRTTARTVRTTPRTVRTTTRTVRLTARPTPQRPRPTAVVGPEEPRNLGPPPVGPPRPNQDVRKPDFLPKSCGIKMFTTQRIIGGGEAAKGSWPWMAVVYVRKSNGALGSDCGGALVTERHVITAAHCIVTGRNSRPLDPSRLSVRLGGHNLKAQNEPGSVTVGVEAVKRHENFESRTYKNDIAVLKLSSPVTFTKRIAPVCLPYDSLNGEEDLTDKTAFVIGYGTTAYNGNYSDVLMEASFDIQEQEVCRRAYEPRVPFSRVYLCAGIMDGSKDACQGDSGGPLLSTGRNSSYYLVGVVSFGKKCGQPGYPGVYTRVTEFLDWLTRNLSN